MTFDDKLDKILLSHGAEQGELHHSLKKAIKDLVLSYVVGEDEKPASEASPIMKQLSPNTNRIDWRNKFREEQRLIINGKEE